MHRNFIIFQGFLEMKISSADRNCTHWKHFQCGISGCGDPERVVHKSLFHHAISRITMTSCSNVGTNDHHLQLRQLFPWEVDHSWSPVVENKHDFTLHEKVFPLVSGHSHHFRTLAMFLEPLSKIKHALVVNGVEQRAYHGRLSSISSANTLQSFFVGCNMTPIDRDKTKILPWFIICEDVWGCIAWTWCFSKSRCKVNLHACV